MKRRPLRRKTPLRAGRASRRASRKRHDDMPSQDKAEAEFKADVLARAAIAGGRCERCCKQGPLQAHHIVPRSRGKGWEYLHDPKVNGAALCAQCHIDVHGHKGDWKEWLRTLPEGKAHAAEVYRLSNRRPLT